MSESRDEEEARKAIKLAKIMNGVAYLLFVIYVLITLYLIFTLGKNTILIIATSIILSTILFFPPIYILNRKIDKLLGIQEQYFKTEKIGLKKLSKNYETIHSYHK